MHILSAAVLVPVLLFDQVTAVGRCVDQHIVRFFLQTALNHSFQVFILNFKLFKRKIIHINDKFVIPVFDLGNDIIKILELMLVNLDHPQALIVVLVQDGLDAGGFAGARVTEQQAVVGRTAFHKGLGVVRQLFLRNVIAHQIVQADVGNIRNGHDLGPLPGVLHPECLVQAQFAHTEILVKLGHDVHECMLIDSRCQPTARLTDPVTDPLVEHLAVLVYIFIIFQQCQTVDAQRFIYFLQIIVKQFLED